MITTQELKSYKLFSGLDESELAGIALLCQRQTYGANAVILEPDNPSESLYIVQDENDAIQVEIPISSKEDKVIVHTLSKGETFGWAAFGSQHVRTAVVRTLGQVTVITINGKILSHYLEQYNHVGYIIMKNLVDIISTRLSYTTVAFRHEIRMARSRVRAAV